MSAARVLHRLQECGVHLRIQGDAIVAAPRDALTDELRALIREHKPALLDAMKAAQPCLDELSNEARELRREKAVQMLRELSSRRSAFLAEERDEQVLVMVAVRTIECGIVTGELAIPKVRWKPASFRYFLDEMDRRTPS